MKLKGISPLEQHVEQIVLVTVSGIFLVVVAAQFLLTTNKVTVGGQELSPGKAFEPAEQKALLLKAQIDRTDVELPPVPEVTVAEAFRRQLQGSVTPAKSLASALGPPMMLEGVIDSESSMSARQIAVVPIPAPVPAAAQAYLVTFDPTEPVVIPELKSYLPAEQPMDKAVVSVEARLDGTAIRSALQQGGENAIPSVWWGNDRTAILGVRLEREEMVEPGTWSNLTEVPPPPGRFDGLVEAAKLKDGMGTVSDLVAEITMGGQQDILQPSFYRTIAGPEWLPPSEAAAKVPVDEVQISNKVRQIRSLRDLNSRSQLQLEEAGATPAPRQPAPGNTGGGKGSAGGAVAPAPRQPTQTTNNARVQSLQGAIEARDKKIEQLVGELAAVGRDEHGNPLASEPEAPGQGSQQQQQLRLMEDAAVRLWTHDLTAEPGKTYRYRVKFAINNPAFGRAAALVEDQKELAAKPELWSEASEWTPPVAVPADRYYFITSASEPSMLGAARVTAEVYEFFYGFYRKGSVGMEPGDMLVAQAKLPDAGKLLIYDVTQPSPGQQPALPTPAPAPVTPGGKGGTPTAIPGGGPDPNAPAPAGELPANATPWDKPLIASEDVILLDVARIPGDGSVVAILRGRDGSLIRLQPRQDPAGMYQLVSTSAKAGENQGQPVLRPVEEPRQRPDRNIPGQREDRTPQPSGGTPGGGSGGG